MFTKIIEESLAIKVQNTKKKTHSSDIIRMFDKKREVTYS